MPENQNQPQSPVSEENPSPTSPQEPTVDVPVHTTDSTPADVSPPAAEAPRNADIPVPLNSDNRANRPLSTSTPEETAAVGLAEIATDLAAGEPQEPQALVDPVRISHGTLNPVFAEINEHSSAQQAAEISASNGVNPEPVQTAMAHIPVYEPLPTAGEPLTTEAAPEPRATPVIIPERSLARELLVNARSALQFRKRKKLEKIMSLFARRPAITNDEVEKLLHVSDATATRYLSQLEKEGRIRQAGKTGRVVSYFKI